MKIINARTWIIANGIAFGVAWKITNKILKIFFFCGKIAVCYLALLIMFLNLNVFMH